MYVCKYVCMDVCIYVYVYMCVCLCMYAFLYTHMCVCVCVCVCASMCFCIYISSLRTVVEFSQFLTVFWMQSHWTCVFINSAWDTDFVKKNHEIV